MLVCPDWVDDHGNSSVERLSDAVHASVVEEDLYAGVGEDLGDPHPVSREVEVLHFLHLLLN